MLSWNLPATQAYSAGEQLTFILTYSAPRSGKYYLLGALYDATGSFISDSLFGIVVPTGENYGIKSSQVATLWAMAEGDTELLPCRLIFDRSGVTLGLFLLRMVGNEIDLSKDEQVGSVSVVLSPPAVSVAFPWESLTGVLIFGMVAAILPVVIKD